MSIASRFDKLRVSAEDDGTRARRLEDLLTADVSASVSTATWCLDLATVTSAAGLDVRFIDGLRATLERRTDAQIGQ